MKWRLMAALAGVGAAASGAGAQAPETVALVGASIVDGNGGQPIADGVVVLQGDRILAVGPRSSTTVPAGARRVDVTGKWITPGLIDAHVHFFQSGGLYTRPDAIDLRTVMPYAQDLARSKARLDDTFARYLASGVTTVVDAGGPMWNFELRRRANASPRAPRVAAAGPLIATEPTERQKRLDLGDPPIISAADAAHARRLARAQLAHRPDFIKIWGIGRGPAGAARVRDITRAVAEVAHPAEIRVAVHATNLATAQAAVAGGADILVHSVDDAPLPDSFIGQLKERGVVYVSTAMVREGYSDALAGRPELTSIERRLGAPDIIASLYEAPAPLVADAAERRAPNPLPQVLANTKMLVAAGGRLAAGTDAGNIGTLHGPAIHRELQLLSRAGLTPGQALTAATRDAAFAFSPRPDVGLVAPGYRADLLVLDADPLQSVGNLGRIAVVWSKGRAFDPATLVPATPESVVELQLQRYNAHDVEGFAATYAQDVEIFDAPGDSRPRLVGREALRRYYDERFRRNPRLNCRVAQRIVEGNYVIDQEVCSIAPDKPTVNAAAIYQVQSGLIRRVWFAWPSR